MQTFEYVLIYLKLLNIKKIHLFLNSEKERNFNCVLQALT